MCICTSVRTGAGWEDGGARYVHIWGVTVLGTARGGGRESSPARWGARRDAESPDGGCADR